MAPSHKPVIWSLFAAGGTFAAFFTPVMILVTGLALPLGLLAPEALGYDRMIDFLAHPLAKGAMFLAVFLPLWHGAHRLRITAHDFGLRADGLVQIICYGAAGLGTVATAVFLIAL